MMDSKNALSHFDYIKQISLAWINQEEYWPKTLKVVSRKGPKEDQQIPVTRGRKKLDTGPLSILSTHSKCYKLKMNHCIQLMASTVDD